VKRLPIALVLFCILIPLQVDAQQWIELTPVSGPAPTPRTLAGAVYDPVAHAMIIFAGQDAGGNTNKVWAFDLTSHTWTDITPSSGGMPPFRRTPAVAYDVHNHQMLMFSGQGATFYNDTWAFDLTSHTWTELMPAAPMPNIRYGVATCYDVVGATQVIFAGFTNMGRFDDTWRFDPTAGGTWSDVSPAAGNPLERCLHAAAYDALDRLMVMYGGQNAGPLSDVWSFDLATETWTDITPAAGPDGRWFSTLEYDPVNRRFTMFGGNRGAVLGRANDVWVLDLSLGEWIEISPSGTAPSARDGACAVQVGDSFYAFGGQDAGGLLNEVWLLDDLSDSPTGVDPPPPGPSFVLEQNRPNPFNPTTQIRYVLDSAQRVVLTVFDVEGRVVHELERGTRIAGPHSVTWDGRDAAGVRVASGVYIYRLDAGTQSASRKMVLLK
jgi:hypothetical protein